MITPAILEILGLLALALTAWLVWDSLRAREAAVAASRAACEAEGYQFLDDTVAIEAIRPARDDDGHLRLRRVYGFEYTDTGESRHRGSIVMLGNEVQMLRIGRHASSTPLRLY
jgi:hypothetical protein